MGDTPTEVVRWAVQPLVQRPVRALLALAALVALSLAVALFAAEIAWGLIAALALGIALNRAFLPSRYAIESGAIVVDHPLRRRTLEWQTLNRIAFDETGALLGGAGLRVSIDLPRDPVLLARVIEALRTNAPEHCTISDRRSIDVAAPGAGDHRATARGDEGATP